MTFAPHNGARFGRGWRFVLAMLAISLVGAAAPNLPAYAATAQQGSIAQYVRSDHPDVYTVVKGDTLWDISGRFLEKPWLWPEIWRVNPQIENPHLIYPGDRIRLTYVDGEPVLSLERGDAGRTYRMSPSTDTKLSPQIRATPLETAIPAIRLDAIQSFLVQNRVVEPSVLAGAPYVLQGESERIIVGAGDRLYIRGELEDNASYSVVRRGPLYTDPFTNEVLGQEATYIGLGRAVGQQDDIGTMFMNSTREEVQIGDRVLLTEERRVQSTFFPSGPSTDIDGRIISVFGGVTQVGQYDVVVVNKGERDGVEVGNVMSIWKQGALARDRIANETVRLPSERAGLMMVFRTFEKLSYGLVLETERPLEVMDEIKNP
ncbi:MAG: LysM peptidoglycan-binding domain-containing protein [Pseudomonadaceae bacterium]|nr:LysM peptidoglycan-binding domain-containing protein [Pseudomonadaceae bacterium]